MRTVYSTCSGCCFVSLKLRATGVVIVCYKKTILKSSDPIQPWHSFRTFLLFLLWYCSCECMFMKGVTLSPREAKYRIVENFCLCFMSDPKHCLIHTSCCDLKLAALSLRIFANAALWKYGGYQGVMVFADWGIALCFVHLHLAYYCNCKSTLKTWGVSIGSAALYLQPGSIFFWARCIKGAVYANQPWVGNFAIFSIFLD